MEEIIEDDIVVAAREGRFEDVIRLCEEGAYVDAQDRYGRTALMYATKFKRAKVAQILLDKNADVNIRDEYKDTALTLAAFYGQTKIAKYLINKGADINAKNRDGCTTLIYAAGNGNKNIVRYLIKKNAYVNVQNNFGDTALIYATRSGQTKIVKYLIKHKADVDIRNYEGYTASMTAERNGYTEMARYLREIEEEHAMRVNPGNVENHVIGGLNGSRNVGLNPQTPENQVVENPENPRDNENEAEYQARDVNSLGVLHLTTTTQPFRALPNNRNQGNQRNKIVTICR